jgi:hypothetical protein
VHIEFQQEPARLFVVLYLARMIKVYVKQIVPIASYTQKIDALAYLLLFGMHTLIA